MTLLTSYRNFMENAGLKVGDFQQQVAKQGLKRICQLREKYPATMRFTPFANGILKSYCPLLNEQEPPVRDESFFIGGQCDFEYRVFGYYYNKNANYGADRAILEWYTATPLRGRIVGVVESASNGGAFQVQNEFGELVPCDSDLSIVRNDARDYGFTTVSAPVAYSDGVVITRAEPFDGRSDECGNPPQIPPTEPPIDPNDFNLDIVVDIGGDDVYLNGDITYEGDSVNIDDLNFNIDGDDFNFDFDGFNKKDAPIAPVSPPKEPFDRDGFNRRFTPDGVEDVPDEVEPEEITEDEVEDEKVEFVIVRISQLPISGKAVLQADPNNSDFFAGYIQWLITTPGGVARSAGIPVRKLRNVFPAPSWSTGYAIYAVNGAKLQAEYYTRKISN